MSLYPQVRNRVQVVEFEPSRTQQSDMENVKLANLVTRYEQTPEIFHIAAQAAQYGDFADVPDMQEAMNMVAEARSLFEQLPSDLRREFDNDPAKFTDAASDPEQKEYLESLGFDASYLPDPPEPKTDPAPGEAPPAAEASPAAEGDPGKTTAE